MVKILIVYDSRSGNTRKMAQAVAQGARRVGGVEVAVKRVDRTSLSDLQGSDGIITGSLHTTVKCQANSRHS
jgi:NAD(P)H dehydrogenase (quinone)